ncbi:3-oxoacyl-[acyl-carrier protein] reductase [Marisediminicola sp. UYEF4]|uniref:SDR family oxidoreductase n=1 Tax=Marisediminicola sp. UYEF4 TaxID=1756384 RepID=UPI00339616F4
MTTSPVATADPTQPVAQRLAGTRVVVTGGARGIGAEIAIRLTSDCARVAVLDRLVDDGTALAARLDGCFAPADLADPASTASAVEARSLIAANRPGKIINIASMAGKSGGAGQAHYAASKAALIALTRVTALELGASCITANSLCPGHILTDMGAATRTDDDVATWSTYSPLGRLDSPRDVAGVAAFLASPDSDYLTGQAINVCGGMHMG